LRRASSLARARKLAAGEGAAVWLEEAPLGLGAGELVRRSGLREEKALAALPAEALRLALPQPWLMARERKEEVLRSIRTALEEFHRVQPLQPGLSREEVRTRVGCSAELLQALLQGAKEFAAEGDLLRLASHKVALGGREDEAQSKMERLFQAAGLTAPAVNEVLAGSGIEANKARTLLQMLLREKKLVRVSAELIFHAASIADLRRQLGERKGQRFGVGEFKDWTGVSRKYAIPLLEFLDRERVTRRDGDQRIVL
jgi:selenocysteine-specific elongation factor